MFDRIKDIKIDRNIIVATVVVCMIALALWFYFQKVEGFNSKESCTLLRKNHNVVVKTMDAIPQNDANTRDAINNGHNFHDMQTRDIILGDEKGSWCSNLNKEDLADVQKAIEEQVGSEVQLFDGGDLMDLAEKQSNDNGIAYDGTDKYDSEYASV